MLKLLFRDTCFCDKLDCGNGFRPHDAHGLCVRVDSLALFRPELHGRVSSRMSMARHWHFCSVACRVAWWAAAALDDYNTIVGPDEVAAGKLRVPGHCVEFFCSHEAQHVEAGHTFDEHLILTRLEQTPGLGWTQVESTYFDCPHRLNEWWRMGKQASTTVAHPWLRKFVEWRRAA